MLISTQNGNVSRHNQHSALGVVGYGVRPAAAQDRAENEVKLLALSNSPSSPFRHLSANSRTYATLQFSYHYVLNPSLRQFGICSAHNYKTRIRRADIEQVKAVDRVHDLKYEHCPSWLV